VINGVAIACRRQCEERRLHDNGGDGDMTDLFLIPTSATCTRTARSPPLLSQESGRTAVRETSARACTDAQVAR
jgi:hypothetical protein